jgi:hypothetical protein
VKTSIEKPCTVFSIISVWIGASLYGFAIGRMRNTVTANTFVSLLFIAAWTRGIVGIYLTDLILKVWRAEGAGFSKLWKSKNSLRKLCAVMYSGSFVLGTACFCVGVASKNWSIPGLFVVGWLLGGIGHVWLTATSLGRSRRVPI